MYRFIKRRYLLLERPASGLANAVLVQSRYGAGVLWMILVLVASAATVAANTHSPFLYFRF